MHKRIIMATLPIVMMFLLGCYGNEMIRTQNVTQLPPKDYYENVFVFNVDQEIPDTISPQLEFVGKIIVQDSEYRVYNYAKEQCLELGGNVLKITSLSKDPWFGYDHRLEADAYNLDWGPGSSFKGQIVKKGLKESDLRDLWLQRGFLSYEGIYQSITAEHDFKYKVGFYKEKDEKYYMVYLAGISGSRTWSEGDVIGIFDTAMYQGVFLGEWVKLDKYTSSAELVFTDKGSFTVTYAPWWGYREGTAYKDKEYEYNYIKMYPKDTTEVSASFTSATGTGFLLNPTGYIVTCDHVVQGAKKIFVIDNNRSKTRLSASVAVSDHNNDLCILKVNGLSYGYNSTLPYGFDEALNKTGESVFCMGYPLTQVMGNEIKVTNGIISSVTGYKGDVSSYQFSAPAQPGNSGGPLFNSSGNVIGVVNAKISQAENVSYAVKTSYLNNLIGLLSDDIKISKATQTSSSLSSLVEKFKPAVYIIEVEY